MDRDGGHRSPGRNSADLRGLRPEKEDSGGSLVRPGASRGSGDGGLTSAGEASRYRWKDIPGSSHDLLRRSLLALPPQGSLLDLGAGPGYLGKAVAGHFSHVTGIESDPSAAPPPGAYDRWITGPIDASRSWDRAFDVIVCADVLEHLPDPVSLLVSARRWIAPQGLLLVSIPNVANLAIRLSLVAGRFEYTDTGILDRTHLRFFTRESANRLIEETGFRVTRIRATPVPAELAAPVLGRAPLRGPSRGFFAAAARVWPTVFGYQFLFDARPG